MIERSYHRDMDFKPTERFSSRADAYVRGRPAYPRDMLRVLELECGMRPEWRVADIGSGTGLLARTFLDYGCEVFGVEPNPQMRAAGERELSGYPNFHSVDGRAEATGLEPGSVDLVTAGQAFHWFEPHATRAECDRILKPHGWVALVWNERVILPGFMAEYEALQDRFARERPHPSESEFTAFFPHGWRLSTVENPTDLDEESLYARMASSSWAPKQDDAGYEEMIAELRRLFRQYSQDGRLRMVYETRIYHGRLD